MTFWLVLHSGVLGHERCLYSSLTCGSEQTLTQTRSWFLVSEETSLVVGSGSVCGSSASPCLCSLRVLLSLWLVFGQSEETRGLFDEQLVETMRFKAFHY